MTNIEKTERQRNAERLSLTDIINVVRSGELTYGEFYAYFLIRSFEARHNGCTASVETLAGDYGTTPRQWQKVRRRLQEKGFLTVQQRGPRTSLLRTTVPEHFKRGELRGQGFYERGEPRGEPSSEPRGEPEGHPSIGDGSRRNNDAETSSSGGDGAGSQTCPDCGGRLKERDGPNGRFLGCSNYRRSNCRYTCDLPGADPRVPTAKCDKCGKHAPEDDLEITATANDGQTEWLWCGPCRDREANGTPARGSDGLSRLQAEVGS